MGSRTGDGSGAPAGVKPGALTDLLRQVAAVPDLPEAEPSLLLPGAVVGRFDIVCELGRGGFGVVYEARDRDLGRQVALKIVRPGAAAQEDGKVSREAEAIARLAHPNLITLYDVGRSNTGPYLVFELLRGKTLQERLDDGPMPLQEAVHIAVEVARGLAHAHAEGVVHRDLKPSNVFVTTKGQVKILDFGMAHAFGRRRLSGGTPAYMAPEQWADDPEDERTDVFALGVMLHRMLSGEYPFPEGEGRWSAGPTTAPKLDVPGAPGLADLVDRMLEKAPKGRPRDGAAVLAALAPIEDALRTSPANRSPPLHPGRRTATFGDLLAELKRRHVLRVMLGYGIFALAVLQVTGPIMRGAHLPEWVLMAVLVSLAVGFLVAAVLGWVYDLTAEGLIRTPSATWSGGASHPRRRLAMLLVAAALLAAAPVAGWYAWKQAGELGQPALAPRAEASVAVLPFADMSPGKDQEYLADGIAEEILNGLAQVAGLRVIGMTSSFSFKGKADDLKAIGQKLGVRTLLEGSVRRAGTRVRIAAHLVLAADGSRIWTQHFDRELADVFAVQDEIARAVVEALRVQLAPGKPVAEAGTSTNPEAVDQYLLGRDLLRSGTKEASERALDAFGKAVAIDPRFARAWVGESQARYFLGYPGKALAAAERAVELAPDLPDAYVARGRVRASVLLDFQGARADLDQARTLGPNLVDAAMVFAFLMVSTGDVALGVAEAERATRLDPLRVHAWATLGVSRMSAGDLDGSRAALARALEISPGSDWARSYLVHNLVACGRTGAALAEAEKARDAGLLRKFVLAIGERDLGRPQESREALEAATWEWATSGDAYRLAEIHAWRGEADLAFEWLEQARTQKDLAMWWVKTDPLLAKLRVDRRFAILLKKMNLPVD